MLPDFWNIKRLLFFFVLPFEEPTCFFLVFSLSCVCFFSSAQTWTLSLELDNRTDGMAGGGVFLLLVHDTPRGPCHRLISKFLSRHSRFYWGKLGIKSLQVNIQKQTGTPEVWELYHVSGMQPTLHERVKQTRSCMLFFCSVPATRVHLWTENLVKSDKIKFFLPLIFPLSFRLLRPFSPFGFICSRFLPRMEQNQVGSHKLNEQKPNGTRMARGFLDSQSPCQTLADSWLEKN